MARCTSDADCRVAEGYLCDRSWRACMQVNAAAIVPPACRVVAGVGRNPAFAPTVPLSTAASGLYQYGPSALVMDDGGLAAMFTAGSGFSEDNALGVSRIDPVGRATIDLPFRSSRARHESPRLARDARGMLYAIWLGIDREGATREIALATSGDRGATWSTPIAVHEPGDCVDGTTDCLARPLVIVGRDPQRRGSEIVYAIYGSQGLRVRASRDGGKTFGPARTALVGTYGNAAVGTDGRLHLVTVRGGPIGGLGSAANAIEYTVSADGGATFSHPQPISRREESVPFYFANPSIAVDSRRGWIYIAYVRGGSSGVWDLVIAASKDQGKTWKRTRIGDDPACTIHMVPNLALDPATGRLHVAWYDTRGATPRFAHAECKPNASSRMVTCTQRGRINDVPFAALSTVRHGATWIGDSQSLVIDHRRRALHAVWTQPVDEEGTIVSRIFHAKAKLPPR